MDQWTHKVALGPRHVAGMAAVKAGRGVAAFARGQEPLMHPLTVQKPAPASRGREGWVWLSAEWVTELPSDQEASTNLMKESLMRTDVVHQTARVDYVEPQRVDDQRI
jgi:hypothetical protein